MHWHCAWQLLMLTSHFLRRTLDVDVFFDKHDMVAGGNKHFTLMKNAYECTHALVVLSPAYRKSEWCVMELNTFMSRRKKQDGLKLYIKMWNVDNVRSYAPRLNDVTRLGDDSCSRWPQNKFFNEMLSTELTKLIDYHGSERCEECSQWKKKERELEVVLCLSVSLIPFHLYIVVACESPAPAST